MTYLLHDNILIGMYFLILGTDLFFLLNSKDIISCCSNYDRSISGTSSNDNKTVSLKQIIDFFRSTRFFCMKLILRSKELKPRKMEKPLELKKSFSVLNNKSFVENGLL